MFYLHIIIHIKPEFGGLVFLKYIIGMYVHFMIADNNNNNKKINTENDTMLYYILYIIRDRFDFTVSITYTYAIE